MAYIIDDTAITDYQVFSYYQIVREDISI